MHRQYQPKHETFIVSKMGPTKFSHNLFKPTVDTILRGDNTEMYKQEGTIESKEALVRRGPLIPNSFFLSVPFCIVSTENGTFRRLNNVVSKFCKQSC